MIGEPVSANVGGDELKRVAGFRVSPLRPK
jgi:hypothetical protein